MWKQFSVLEKGGEPKVLENVVLTSSEIQVEKEKYKNETIVKQCKQCKHYKQSKHFRQRIARSQSLMDLSVQIWSGSDSSTLLLRPGQNTGCFLKYSLQYRNERKTDEPTMFYEILFVGTLAFFFDNEQGDIDFETFVNNSL